MSNKKYAVGITFFVAAILLSSCRSNESNVIGETERRLTFANIESATASYVGDASCASCHSEEYAGFQNHGMSHSFYPVRTGDRPEDFSIDPIYHAASNFYYQPIEIAGEYFQEEFRLDSAGKKIHSVKRRMDYVVGSGGAAYTYLTSDNGHLFELPLTWYTQPSKWDFSPGYEATNLRFDRLIPDRCMACHNSVPEDVPNLEGKYVTLPEGIGCERCHGPGSIHVDERLSDPDVSGIDTTIVNPVHVSLDRRLDVCQQCHLNGSVDVLREGKSAFDFQPSQLLSEHQAMFIAHDSDSSEVRVISHADRMKQSECFLGTLNSPAPLECTTCHDPHAGFRDQGYAYFTQTCLSCHPADELLKNRPPKFTEDHNAQANCISCHMPKAPAQDVPHASFTDHFIRVVGEDNAVPLGIPDALTSRESRMVAVFDQDQNTEQGRIYEGIALVTHGRHRGDLDAIREGISLLDGTPPDEFPKAQFILGLGNLFVGNVQAAITPLENAVRLDPDDPEKLNSLAQAYEAESRSPDVIERLYVRALDIQPANTEIRLNYGRYLLAVGSTDRAIRQFESTIQERPAFAQAYYNLGTAKLQKGDITSGLNNLYLALALDPDNIEAMGNVGFAHATSGSLDSAQVYFERAVDTDETSPVALGNLGAFYLNSGLQESAIEILLRAVASKPDFADALANLSLAYFQIDEHTLSRTYAERTLEVNPDNQLARQILEAL